MDQTLRHRINAGRVAISNQVDFFINQFGRVPSEWKEDDTRVTFVDFAISEKIFTELRKSFPTDDYCSEEFSPQDEVLELKRKYAWVLDPVDGTNNYALGIPICAISLALLKNGEPVYGFVYDMSRRKLLEGGPGVGLFEGRRKITPQPRELTRQSLVGLHFPLTKDQSALLAPVFQHYRIRSIGSGALMLAYTALGLLDGCVDFRIKVWDIAAGYAMLKAVGGEFAFLGGDAFPLKEFHVTQDHAAYFAGHAEFAAEARQLLLK